MLKDPFPNPRRQKSSGDDKIGGAYLSSLKVQDPRMKILVLVGMLVVLGLAAFLLEGYAATPEANRIADEPAEKIGTDLKVRFSGVPALDPAIAERISDQGPDARRRWPEEAIDYLMHEVQYRAAVRAYARNLFPLTAGNAEQIRADSRGWRFKYVYFRGELEDVREENYEETYGEHPEGEIGQVKRGIVKVAGGGELQPPLRVTFLTPSLMQHRDPNVIDADIEEITGGWVRVRGIFVKNYVDERPDGTEVPSMLVIATVVERDYETEPVESLADIDFEIILDNPAIADTAEGQRILAKNFPRPMFQLVKHAEKRAGEPGRELREKENLRPKAIDDSETLQRVIGSPAEYRGEYFGGFGIIALEGLSRGPSDVEPNRAGVEGYFEGWLLTDREKLVRFVAPEPLMHRDWPKRTRVRWAGYFYKALGYPARDRSRRLAPFVVLTELEEIVPEPRDVQGELVVAFGALAGLALLVWILVREDKTKSDFRRSRRRVKVEA